MIHIRDLESVQPDATVFGTKGVIDTVWPPKEPTPGQAKHGLHNQSVLLRDLEGNAKFMVKLSCADHHVDKTAEGRVMTLVSGKDNSARMVGLQMKEWNDKKYLEAGRSAQVKVDQNQPVQPSRPQTTRREPTMPTTTLTLDDLATQHRTCFDSVVKAYAGSGLPIENLTAIATSMFIEGNRAGLFKRSEASAPAPAPKQEAPAPAPAQQDKPKVPVEDMTPEQVTEALHVAYRLKSEGNQSKRVFELIDEGMLRVIPFTDAIKHYKKAFVAKHDLQEWNKRVASLRNSLKLNPDDHEGLAKIIVTDQLTFEGIE